MRSDDALELAGEILNVAVARCPRCRVMIVDCATCGREHHIMPWPCRRGRS